MDLFFDYLAMRLIPAKTEGKRINLNFDFTDLKKKYAVVMVHGVLNHTEGRKLSNADATVTLTRDTLNSIMLKQTTLAAAVSSGAVKVQGNQAKLEELVSYLDSFDLWFNIVTP